MALPLTLFALLFELAFGYSQRLVRSIGHPVMWMGALIATLDRRFNIETMSDDQRRRRGTWAAATIVLAALCSGIAVQALCGLLPFELGLVPLVAIASTLIAQRSLGSHVTAVADALDTQGLEAGRAAVAQIVGRDPDMLDEAGVIRAAIESLAENFSDGVVAPTIWLAIAGLGGGAVYKAVNTADSMIGHRTHRHRDFGRASARLDDLLNLPASRCSAALIVMAAALVPGASARQAWAAVRADANRHNSPNAGWPEAAMAGALGIALGGPRAYDGKETRLPTMGKGGRTALTRDDLRRALVLYRIADGLMIVAIALLAGLALMTAWRFGGEE